jgi:folate-binding protein YgfZ
LVSSIPNPLLDLHRQNELAEFQPYGQALEIVSTFGQPQAEYAALHKTAGLMDLPQRGLVELTGMDRLTFLNNLLTNQTFDKQSKTGMAAGSGVYAFLLDAKTGRIRLDVNVLELGERTLLELDARLVEPLVAMLERYHFAEQVKFTPRTTDLHEIAVHGPGAAAVLSRVLDGATELPPRPITCAAARMIGHDVILWRDDPCGVPGYFFVMPTSAAAAVWEHFIATFGNPEQLGKRDLRPIGWAAYNATRIEAGRALFGIDFDDTILPAETGEPTFARAVSMTKGCYPGQEVVARMYARQQVAKRLVGIRMDAGVDALPIAGAPVYDMTGDTTIGGITSSTLSPILSNAAIALGFVKRPNFAPGTKLMIPAEGATRPATVVDQPFKGDAQVD